MSEKITTPVSYAAGGTTTALGLLTLNDWALIVGIVATLGTFAINWVYKHRAYQLEKARVDAELRKHQDESE